MFGRRRRGRKFSRNFLFGQIYLNTVTQYSMTIVSAIVLSGLVFSGFLLFRHTDSSDLLSRGKQQMAEGRVAWAARTFQTLVNRYPDNYDGYVMLGQAYLEMGDRKKAEKSYQSALLLQSKMRTGDNDARLAMARLQIVQKKYTEAEESLLALNKRHKKEVEIKEALVSLYESWAEDEQVDKTETEIDWRLVTSLYKHALLFCTTFETEEHLRDKIVSALGEYANQLMAQKKTDMAAQVLQHSLKFRYRPTTLVDIAETYQSIGKTDEAIRWYRKAFDSNPDIISLKLSNILIAKGRELLAAKKADEAKHYFDEADEISRLAKVPLDVLYPVTANPVKVSYKLDPDTGEILPKVQVTFKNMGVRDLGFLACRVKFLTDDEEISEIQEVVATTDKPLQSFEQKKEGKDVFFTPDERLNLNQLNGGRLRIRVEVSYNEDEGALWHLKALQEIKVSKPIPASSQPELEEDNPAAAHPASKPV